MDFFSWILYIAIAILALLFMITIHEFGHWTAGKLLKFKINEFSIGFGKAIYQKTNKNGEKFSIRIFPLGGYCAFEGEDEDKKEVVGAFNSQKPWKRLIVLFMGAFFNFLSAIIFSAIFLMSFGYADKVQVKSVEVPSIVEAGQEQTWLMEGDIILAVNGTETNFVYDQYFNSLIAGYETNEEFSITVKRDGQEIILNDICRSWFALNFEENTDFEKAYSTNGVNFSYAIIEDNSDFKIVKIDGDNNILATYTPDDSGEVTIDGYKFLLTSGASVAESSLYISKIGVITQYYKYGFFEVIGESFAFCFKWAWKILIILWQLVSGQLALNSLGGMVTTVVTIAEVTSQNFANLLLLVPLISINLAVFNLLPIPALDGARMVFVGIEWVRKKPINRKIEANIHFVGLVILLAFIVLVDILHFML
ncbi:MAG: RIP metalloprotease RseP [Clostridia bacterium]|nr:RIP metalloprotease RseP [Clostridia bacterium]